MAQKLSLEPITTSAPAFAFDQAKHCRNEQRAMCRSRRQQQMSDFVNRYPQHERLWVKPQLATAGVRDRVQRRQPSVVDDHRHPFEANARRENSDFFTAHRVISVGVAVEGLSLSVVQALLAGEWRRQRRTCQIRPARTAIDWSARAAGALRVRGHHDTH